MKTVEDKSVSTDKTGAGKSKDQSNKLAKKPIRWGIWTLLCLCLLMLVAGSWFGYHYIDQYRQQVHSSVDSLSQQVVRQNKQLAELKQEQFAWQESVQKQWQLQRLELQEWQDAVLRRQAIADQKLNQVIANNDYQWLFAEVQYWLSLAHQRMAIDPDAGASIRLLKSAKQQLSVLNSKESEIISKAIDKDIDKLQASQILSSQQLFNQLNRLQKSLTDAAFAFKPAQQLQSTDPSLANTDDSQLSWIEKTLHFMDNLFSLDFYVDYQGKQGSGESMTQQRMLMIRQQVALVIEQAKLASLQNDTDTFSTTVKSLIDTVDIYYQAPEQLALLESLVMEKPTLQLNSWQVFKQQMVKLNIDN